jgi:hypothetical protein
MVKTKGGKLSHSTSRYIRLRYASMKHVKSARDMRSRKSHGTAVQCRDCNGKLGAHIMLDWMAAQSGYPRGQIKPLLLKRLYASYSQAARVFPGMPFVNS